MAAEHEQSEDTAGFKFVSIPCNILESVRNKSKDTVELLEKW